MHFVVSGEGKTDIGMFAYDNNTFIAGSMYYIVDKIIEKKHDLSYYDHCRELITFIPKADLIEVCKSMKSLAGKKLLRKQAIFLKMPKDYLKLLKQNVQKKMMKRSLLFFSEIQMELAVVQEMYGNKKLHL